MKKDILQDIRLELTRTEEMIRNNNKMYGFSSDNIKVELDQETYIKLSNETSFFEETPTTVFGFDLEIKANLKRDFIIYVDTYNLI